MTKQVYFNMDMTAKLANALSFAGNKYEENAAMFDAIAAAPEGTNPFLTKSGAANVADQFRMQAAEAHAFAATFADAQDFAVDVEDEEED